MKSRTPESLRIRVYQVGFGACSLLTFYYSRVQRHVLVDFGSARPHKRMPSLADVARQIKEECGGRLNGLVVSNRQLTRLAGLATNEQDNKKGDEEGDAGSIIASCKPEIIVRPWTDDPQLESADSRSNSHRYGSDGASFAAGLRSIRQVADEIEAYASSLHRAPDWLQDTATFICDLNMGSPSATKNLNRMAARARSKYVYYGSRSGLEAVLPGVEIHVLGPPLPKQAAESDQHRSRHTSEYWEQQAKGIAGLGHRGSRRIDSLLFPKAKKYRSLPVWARWTAERLTQMSDDSTLQLVESVHSELDNTSVILLFKIGDVSMLFPADAHYGGWSRALEDPKIQNLLTTTRFYNVGNHGTKYGTPRSLWSLLPRDPLFTINSTMGNLIGDWTKPNQRVPHKPLVNVLADESDYISTQDIESTKHNYVDFIFDFPRHEIKRIHRRKRKDEVKTATWPTDSPPEKI